MGAVLPLPRAPRPLVWPKVGVDAKPVPGGGGRPLAPRVEVWPKVGVEERPTEGTVGRLDVVPKAEGFAPKADVDVPPKADVVPVEGDPNADVVLVVPDPKADVPPLKADDVVGAPKADLFCCPKALVVVLLPKAEGADPKAEGVDPKAEGEDPKADD